LTLTKNIGRLLGDGDAFNSLSMSDALFLGEGDLIVVFANGFGGMDFANGNDLITE
jgi:hypothetical protein